MVEGTTTQTAKMALRLRTARRWCVTGTPIGSKGVEDLHGLLVFLRHQPFASSFWWRLGMQGALARSAAEGTALLVRIMQPIMWRNSKLHVKDELRVPPMTSKTILLELTTAEREVYNKIEQSIREASIGGLVGEGDQMQLRLACAHPQMTRFWTSLGSEGQVRAEGGGTSLVSHGLQLQSLCIIIPAAAVS